MGKIEYLLDGVVLSPFSLLSQLTQDTRALVDALTGGGYYLVAFFQIGSPGADEMFLSNRPEKGFRRQWSAHLKSRMFFLDYGKNSDLDHAQTNDFQIGSLEADEMFLSNRPKKSFWSQWFAHLKSRMSFLDYEKSSNLDHSQTNDLDTRAQTRSFTNTRKNYKTKKKT